MTEVNPQESKRTEAYALWLHAPMPMLTFFKTLDVVTGAERALNSIC